MRMPKMAISLAVVVFGLASMMDLHAASLAGVTLPNTAQVGSTTLALNGLGLRTKFGVKVYVAGLYLAQKSSDPNAIIKSDSPKGIAMQFVHGHAHFTGLNAENPLLPLADLRDR